jgi:hypothetical protein
MSQIDQLNEDDVDALLPGPTSRGLGAAYMRALAKPLLQLDEKVYWLVDAVNDLDAACGGALDLLGDWVNEPRGGLQDGEYRRIIGGRRVVFAGGVTPRAVYRCWERMTEGEDATLTETPLEITLTTLASFNPTTTWLSRATSVLRDVRAAGRYVYGRIDVPGGFRWDETGFEIGFSADLGA